MLEDATPYYQYTPDTLLENATHKLYWDRTLFTDKTVHYNRPDITLIDKDEKTLYLIDVAIPNTHNLQSKHTEKLTKYTDLAIELKEQWHMNKVVVVPIILSTTGVIPKTLHTSLHTLGLHHDTYIQLQKAVIINTCHTVRKFFNTTHMTPHPVESPTQIQSTQ